MHSFLTVRRLILTLILGCGLIISSCGGGGGGGGNGNEVINLHVINGYPGSSSMTLYGPTGPIVQNLGFGLRTEEPVAVDRNISNEFMLVIDGAPQPIDFEQDLFSLHPHETGTLFIKRRTGINSAAFTLFRHVRSVAPSCRLVLHNSLSVNNTAATNFNFLGGWDFSSDIRLGGYNSAAEDATLSSLESQFPDEDFSQLRQRRDNMFTGINAHPFFVMVPANLEEDEDIEGLKFVWIGPEDGIDIPFVDFQGGGVHTHPNTQRFIRCLEEVAEGAPDDDDDDAEAELDFDSCGDRRTFTTQIFRPDADGEVFYYHYSPASMGHTGSDRNVCDASLRIFSDFSNIFSGDHGYDGYEDNVRINVEPEFNVSDHYFFVLFGYPANPEIAFWRASDDFGEPLPDYPGF